MSAIDYAFIGLPKSGKTSFLAALWHLIESGDLDGTKLKLARLEGDQSHLTNLANLWRSGSVIPRTSTALEATVKIHIQNIETSNTYVLSFPDIDGESFEHQIENRSCKKEYFDSIESNTGIFLFVSANTPLKLSLRQLNEAFPDLDDEPDEAVQEQQTAEEEVPAETQDLTPSRSGWTHKAMPFQVKVVELLQFLQASPFTQAKRKVSIMISAWDVVSPKCKPSEWMATNMPLLDQYLKTNPDLFEIKLYGISALGGDINDTQKLKELLEMEQTDRMTCECDLTSSSDITAPIVWMMAEN